jgi:hypothetical protein
MTEVQTMNAQVDGNLLLLPRPWLQPPGEEVRERGPLTTWTCGGRTYVKGVVGTKVLAYWHRVVAPLRPAPGIPT